MSDLSLVVQVEFLRGIKEKGKGIRVPRLGTAHVKAQRQTNARKAGVSTEQ